MEININQAVIAHQEGKLKEAEQLYRSILEIQPSNFIIRNNLGVLLRSLGKYEEAKASYLKAIELNPDYADAYCNLGNILKNYGKYEEAEANYIKAIKLKPDYAEAHYNLGNILYELSRFAEAEIKYRKTIKLKPNYSEAHSNLGATLQNLDKLEESIISIKKAIILKPDNNRAHFNLGNTFYKLGKIEEAESSYKKAIDVKPNYFEAHNNLGYTLNYKGDLEAAINSYKTVLNIKPDYTETWHNIYFPLQAMKSQTSSIEEHLPLIDEQKTTRYVQSEKSILSYCLNLGNPSANNYLDKVHSILSSADNIFIKNPRVSSKKLTKPTLLKKIIALIHFGRSGTGLLHSLIDGHPEVSTLPSIYFSEFFDHFTWEKIIAGGWEEMANRFTTIYAVLFDASSTVKIPSKNKKLINNIGKKEGMMNVGIEKREVLSVDKKIFIKELKKLMDCYDRLDSLTFFKLVHSAYEITLKNLNKKKIIFYHIHNPDTYAQLNFLRLAPNTNWLMMVREPLQSCESWVFKNFEDNDYKSISNKIFQMLFEIDQIIFQKNNFIGVRIEDLKQHPKKTISALCDLFGIKENDSLYEMTAQGKKWWGDPSSPDYKKDGMDPFGKSSINRKLGLVFSKNDQFILRTLFYPFSARFNYVNENLEQFKNDLQSIRPMLNQMLDFERKIAQNTKINSEEFMKSGPYLFLRSGMIERWNTLNKFHTYHNMLTPLKIDQF